MDPGGEMSAIFISYSSADVEQAEELKRVLADQKYASSFLAVRDVDGGAAWEQVLHHELRGCRALLALWSVHSSASRWCFAEISQARSLGKAVLPVRLDETPLDPILAHLQGVDFCHDRAAGLEQLLRGLQAAGLDPRGEWNPAEPYPGLRPINRVLDLVDKVRRYSMASPVVVLGASGTGKSSLVRAGVIPRLTSGSPHWIVLQPFRARNNPIDELAGVLSSATGGRRTLDEISNLLRGALASDAPDGRPLVRLADDIRRA
jgi:hypothetical protein